MLEYIDTIAISKKININPNALINAGWIYISNNNNPITAHYKFEIKVPNSDNVIFLKYFHKSPLRRLSIQFNIRKLITNSNNNSDPVVLNQKPDLYNYLNAVIMPVINSYIPIHCFEDFQVSRVDIAYNHIISEYDRDAFYDSLHCLSLSRFHRHNYGDSTSYFNSSATKFGGSGIVVRIYDKTKEMLSKGFTAEDAYQIEIDEDQTALLAIEDDGYLIESYTPSGRFVKVRFEGMFKKRKIEKSLKQHRLQNTLENVLDESFQLQLLDEYILALKVDAPFCSRQRTLQHIDRLFLSKKTNKKVKRAVSLINNHKFSQLSSELNTKDPTRLLKKYEKILYDDGNGCHMIYTKFVNLEPVRLPSVSTPSN